jgi:2,3-bisphosphoglycerate-dependent phosphoglycerate mutase
MKSTKLLLIRHGQTEWNKIRRWQGQTDVPLSELGVVQARDVALQLANHTFDVIISSDLQRALQTAVIINEHHNHEIKLEPLLREQHYGIAQGLMRDEVPQQFSEVEHKPFGQPEPEYNVPEAETYVQLVDRASRILHHIIDTHAGKTVLIVAHGSLIRSLIRYALKNHRIAVEMDNCGIAQFHHDTELVFTGFIGNGGKIGDYE